jgi:putative endonuclease
MWFVYILLCSDGSFYTGSTNDVEKRLEAHLAGKGAKYTKSHKPKRIIYQESFQTKSEALKREIEIKKLTKIDKLKLVKNWPEEIPMS